MLPRVIPVGDDDNAPPGFPYVNLALIVACVVVFLYQLINPDFTTGYSAVPAEITTGRDLVGVYKLVLPDGTVGMIPETPGPSPIWLTLLTSIFMHGGWSHLGGNMLFLWVFGRAVEDRVGSVVFFVFYLLAGALVGPGGLAGSDDAGEHLRSAGLKPGRQVA